MWKMEGATYCQESLELLEFPFEFLVVFFQSGAVLLDLLRLRFHFALARLQIPANFDQLVVVSLHALSDATNPLAQNHVGLRRDAAVCLTRSKGTAKGTVDMIPADTPEAWKE